jgi:ligand-binding sensor domain-containing protein
MQVRRATSRIIAILAIAASVSLAIASTPAAGWAAGPAKWSFYRPTNTGIPGDYVTSIAFDSAGKRWLTANDPIWDEGGLARFDGKTWKDYTNVDGKAPAFNMDSVRIDAAGTPWMASDRGWSPSRRDHVHRHPDGRDDLGRCFRRHALAVPQGGVARYDGATWTTYTSENSPLPHEQVVSVALDAAGNAWVSTASMGVAKITLGP